MAAGRSMFLQSLSNKTKNNTVTTPVIHANPAGDWHIGGFDADAGLTGRKLAVDNYGPRIPLGGWAARAQSCRATARIAWGKFGRTSCSRRTPPPA